MENENTQNSLIDNVSQQTKDALRRLSAQSLPNRPSASGMKAEDIKKAFYEPIYNASNSAIAEIDRVITALNEIFSSVTSLDSLDLSSDEAKNPAAAGVVKAYIDNLVDGLKGNGDNSFPTGLGTVYAIAVAVNALQNAKAGEAFGMVQSGGDVTISEGVISIGNQKVTEGKIVDCAVTTGKIGDGAVTEVKLDNGLIKQIKDAITSVDYDSNIESDGYGTFIFKNNAGNEVQKINLPLELIVDTNGDSYYDSETKDLMIKLANGQFIAVPADDLVQELMDYINGIHKSIYTLQKAPPLSAFDTAVLLNTPTIAQLARLSS